MFTHEDQLGMKDCIAELSEAIVAADEVSVRLLMRTYNQYCQVCAQENRLDLIQDGSLGTDAIRAAFSQALRPDALLRDYPASIIEHCLAQISFKPGVLSRIAKVRPDLHPAIAAHFKARPFELGIAMATGWSDPYRWILELVETHDPETLGAMLELNLPRLEGVDHNVLEQVIPRLNLMPDESSIRAFFSQWEQQIQSAWKRCADVDGNVLSTELISLITRFGTDELKNAIWDPLLNKGCYQNYEPIRQLELSINQEQIKDWLGTGYQHASFIYCLAIENESFDLKKITGAVAKSISKDREWIASGLEQAVSATSKEKPLCRKRLLAVTDAVAEGFRGHPAADKMLYALEKATGRDLVLKTSYGSSRADLFFSSDLGL